LQGFSQLYFAILKKQLWSSQTDVFIGIVRPNYCYTICLQIVVICLIPSFLLLTIFYLYSEIHCMSHKNFFNFDFFPLRMGWGEIDLNPSLTFDLLAKFFLAEQTKDLIIAPINEPKDLSKKNSFFFFFFFVFKNNLRIVSQMNFCLADNVKMRKLFEKSILNFFFNC